MAIEKPKPQTRSALDYNECVKYIEEKLGYDIRDTLDSSSHYGKWCESIGEVPDGNSQKQFARYKAHPEGEAKCPEYCDWWHYLIDHRSISNGCIITIGSDLLEDGNEWQNAITQAFIDEFGDNTVYYVEW